MYKPVVADTGFIFDFLHLLVHDHKLN